MKNKIMKQLERERIRADDIYTVGDIPEIEDLFHRKTVYHSVEEVDSFQDFFTYPPHDGDETYAPVIENPDTIAKALKVSGIRGKNYFEGEIRYRPSWSDVEGSIGHIEYNISKIKRIIENNFFSPSIVGMV
jgi:hypothetical protein